MGTYRKPSSGSNLKSGVNNVLTGQSSPDDIKDLQNHIREARDSYAKYDNPKSDYYVGRNSSTQSKWDALIEWADKAEAAIEKTKAGYEGLSRYERPAEAGGAYNIQQQGVDSGKSSAEIAQAALDARMRGETYTVEGNKYLDAAKDLASQGIKGEEFSRKLSEMGASGAQITSLISDGYGSADPSLINSEYTRSQEAGEGRFVAGDSNRTAVPLGQAGSGQIEAPRDSIEDLMAKGYSAYGAKNELVRQYEQRGLTAPSEYTSWDGTGTPPSVPQTTQQSGGTQNGGSTQQNGTVQGGGTQQNGTQNGGTGDTPANGQADQQSYNNQAALDFINNADLDEGTKSMFREVIRNWDPNSDVNIDNVLKTFTDLKNSTISPYFKEQSNLFIDQLTKNRDFAAGERERQLESEKMQGEQQIKGAQAGLEQSGLTFSGKAGELLGDESALGQNEEAGIPTQGFGEGLVQQQQRLMTTTSEARRKKQLEDMQRSAEATLGSQQSAGLISGVDQIGGLTGSMVREEKQAQGQALTGVYNQELQNVAARKKLEVF